MCVLKSIFRLFFLAFICSSIFGCQDSEPLTLEVQEENQLESNSQLANLIQRISLRDGSKDNIIDAANCISILLPITVTANSEVLTIEAEADFQLIENIFEASSTDTDVISIQFPITIILNDHSQQIVNNQEQLESFADQCNGENQPDDDIECVDFKYPLEFKVTVIGGSIPSTFDITNDKELLEFFENVEKDAIINLTFPITLIDSDNEEMVVTNLDDLEDFIEDGMDDCDEDDDFDYDDDDDRVLVDFITKGNWIIDEYSEMGEGFTENYEDFIVSFQTDGTVSANNGQQVVSGTWSIDLSNAASQRFILNFEAIAPFDALNQNWLIEESEADLLALRNGSEPTGDLNILVFEKP